MLLECKNISFKYPGADNHILKDLSFNITKPGFNGLFGPSGVGKTSFAKIISGNLNGFSGHVRTNGMDNVLYSYNLERLPGWSSVRKHLDKITPLSNKRLRDELVDLFGMESCMNLKFTQLSLGQKNRINLVRYLLQEFHILIMDESLANVDEKTREKIILNIKVMFPEACFLYISHNVVEVSKFCEHILVFRDVAKRPQTLLLDGQNHTIGKILRKQDLEHTMLEIMYAS